MVKTANKMNSRVDTYMGVVANKDDSYTQSRTGIDFTLPLWLLLAAVVVCGAILSLPIAVPIGPMYWDVFIYYDAANRIFSGQVPIVDFFAPVGPLGYYLAAGLIWLFPNGQPSLLAPWSLLIVSAPLMGIVLWEVGSRSRVTAMALLIPFLLFALLPFNTREFYPLPGSDAFGIYNRQSCQLLYTLVAALMFVRKQPTLLALLTLIMTALFFLKITGFAVGGIICAYAFLAGRVQFRTGLLAALAFAAILAVIEVTTGIVSAYVDDVLLLVSNNSGSLFSRLRESASQNFDVVVVAAALIAVLGWAELRRKPDPRATIASSSPVVRVQAFFNLLPAWLAAMLFAGVLFEAQNTGSQGFIFLWPVLLAILLRTERLIARPALLLTVAGLVAAIALPPALTVFSRAARTYIGGANNPALVHRNLKTLGAVNMRQEVSDRADRMLAFYPAHRAFYVDLIGIDENPTPLIYSDFHFQIGHLKAQDHAIDSIRALEAAKGIRFETIMTLDFTNPFPWLMDRSAPLHISIGADPFRTVPTPGPEVRAAVAEADLALYPTCPPTINNTALYAIYAEALAGHKRVKLDDCYDALVNPKFAAALGL